MSSFPAPGSHPLHGSFIRNFALFTASLALAILFSAPAWAHRSNIFAWEEGGNINVECSFSGGKPVMNAAIKVLDAAGGAEVALLKTDAKGMGSFPIPDAARQGRMDLRLVLHAGEGHQGEWIITADEYLGELPGSQESAEPAAAPEAVQQPAAATAAIDETALRRVMDEALDKRLGHINRQLAALADPAPGVRDIVGGIGWIIGLFGMAALVRGRKN